MNTMKTVGPILKKAREERGLKIKAISHDTKIPPRFLEALEEGRWSLFSSAVHAKGFLKIYADYLGLNIEEILAFWRREYREKPERKSSAKAFLTPLQRPRFVVTPGLVVSLATITLVVFFLGYLFTQYRSFAGAPILIIDQPMGDIATEEASLTIVGRTDPDAEVFINGQKISVSEKGSFSTSIALAPGANILNFEAVNKLGKSRRETRTVIFEDKKPSQEEAREEAVATESAKPEEVEGLKLQIEIGPRSAWLRVVTDQKQAFEGVVVAGGKKEFFAQNEIYFKTGNAGSTTVWINGNKLKSLGSEGEVVEKEYTLGELDELDTD